MSYNDVLMDQSAQLAFAATDSGKVVHVTGSPLISEIINAMRTSINGANNPLVQSLSDAAISQLRDVLSTVLSTTYNQAVPQIKKILEQMNQVINPDIPVAYTQYEIIPVIFSEIWDSPVILEIAEKGRHITPTQVSLVGLIDSIDAEEYSDLAALAETGLASFDAEVRELIAKFEPQALRQLFNDAFCYGCLPNSNLRDIFMNNAQDSWILVNLWARRLYDIVPAKSAMNLDQYRLAIVSIEEQSFAAIASIDAQRRAYSEANRLIIEQTSNKAYVINDLYVTYLREGGTPEAILGLLLNGPHGRRLSTAEELKEAQATLLADWNRHVQISSATHAQQVNASARRQLMLILDEHAKLHFGDENGVVSAENQGPYRIALDKIAEGIQALPEDFTRDIHRWVFKIVGEAFYAGSDVKCLLENLREVGDTHGSELSPEEVKVIAAINYIADWLADLTETTNHQLGRMPTANTTNVGMESIDDMGLEAIDAKTAVAVVGGVVLAAVVGYGVYKLINRGKSTTAKLEKAAEKVEAEIVKLEEEVKQAGPGLTVPARSLLENESIKNALLKLPKHTIDEIIGGKKINKIFVDEDAINSLFDSITTGARSAIKVTEAIRSSAQPLLAADKVVSIRNDAAATAVNSLNEVAKKFKMGTLPPAGSVDEALKKGEELIEAHRERLEKEFMTEETLLRVLDTDKEIEVDGIIEFSKGFRSRLRTIHAQAKEINRNNDVFDKSAESIELLSKEVKQVAPGHPLVTGEGKENNPNIGYGEAVIGIATQICVAEFMSAYALFRIGRALAKKAKKD